MEVAVERRVVVGLAHLIVWGLGLIRAADALKCISHVMLRYSLLDSYTKRDIIS